ncbi:MAG: hypothetical protein EAX96_12785 [Candidatus Lokiarchaeota archaeon]|nr:hypothetical protein [Candidatus Lokiarchaeota archaeon]
MIKSIWRVRGDIMSLGVANLHYFLIGVFIFMMIKFVDRFKYFEDDQLFSQQIAKVWNFIFGSSCIIMGINGLFAITQIAFSVQIIDYRNLFPTILLFISSGIFLSDSFKNPTKNYLVSLGIGVLISTFGALIPFFIALIGPDVVFGVHITYINYILLIPFLITVMVAIGVGMLIYFKLLKPRHAEWNEQLWDKSKIWNLVNNRFLLLTFSLIIFFEILFQWHSTSLLSLFFQLP